MLCSCVIHLNRAAITPAIIKQSNDRTFCPINNPISIIYIKVENNYAATYLLLHPSINFIFLKPNLHFVDYRHNANSIFAYQYFNIYELLNYPFTAPAIIPFTSLSWPIQKAIIIGIAERVKTVSTIGISVENSPLKSQIASGSVLLAGD